MRWLCFLLCAYLLLGPVSAQEAEGETTPTPPAAARPEPEDIGVVYRLTDKGEFAPLEMVRATRETHTGLFAGAEDVLTVPGKKSPIRFAAGQSLEFVVRVMLPVTDPRSVLFQVQDPTRFELLLVEPDGDERKLILSEQGAFSSRRTQGAHIQVRTFGDHSFKLLCSQSLPPGEYAFKYGANCEDSQNLYCFGVDKAKP